MVRNFLFGSNWPVCQVAYDTAVPEFLNRTDAILDIQQIDRHVLDMPWFGV